VRSSLWCWMHPLAALKSRQARRHQNTNLLRTVGCTLRGEPDASTRPYCRFSACCNCRAGGPGLLFVHDPSLAGALVPTNETVEAVSHVPILVGTTRTRSSSDPGEMFSRDLSNEIAFGQVTVSIPPDHSRAVGEIQWPVTLPGDPRRDFVTVSAEYLDRVGFGGAITTVAKARHRSKAMVFVHGFNNRFDDAVYRFAQFVQDGRLPVVPVLFSWPSQGVASLSSYEYDRKVAMQSSAPLAQLLDTVNSNPSIKEHHPCLPFHGLPGNS
jgi:esterase/lipase superfamily enzyme